MTRGLEGAAIGGIDLQSRSCQRKRTSPSLRRRNWLGFPKENSFQEPWRHLGKTRGCCEPARRAGGPGAALDLI